MESSHTWEGEEKFYQYTLDYIKLTDNELDILNI